MRHPVRTLLAFLTGLVIALVVWPRGEGSRANARVLPIEVTSALVVNPKGTEAISATSLGWLHYWDVPSGKLRFSTRAAFSSIRALALSPDARALAVGMPGSIELWDVAKGMKTATLTKAVGTPSGLEYLPDGRSLVSVSQEGTLHVWDLERGKPRFIQALPGTGWGTIASNRDGSLLAVGAGGVVRIWDLRTGKKINDLEGFSPPPYALALSPDGKSLATGSGSVFHGTRTEITLWDVATGDPRRYILYGENHQPVALRFARDGRTLHIADIHGLDVWDLVGGRRRLHWRPETTFFSCACWSADERVVVLAELGNPRALTVFPLPYRVPPARPVPRKK